VYYLYMCNKFFKKNYWNVIIVPATMAKLLEWHDGQEQSSWVSVRRRKSYDVTLTCRDADQPHTDNSKYRHHPLKAILIAQYGFVPWPAAATLAHP